MDPSTYQETTQRVADYLRLSFAEETLPFPDDWWQQAAREVLTVAGVVPLRPIPSAVEDGAVWTLRQARVSA